MNNENAIDIGETATLLNTNIKQSKDKIITCPAVILANRRMQSANGFVNKPMNSTTIIIGNNAVGIP